MTTTIPPIDPQSASVIKTLKDVLNTERRTLSQRFGHIPGVPIFTHWDKRVECSDSAVHRSIMAGICGNNKAGAYSVVLSGLYADDEDGGDVIIYTGSGGREKWTNTSPPKRLRFGPQTMDQSWDTVGNRALQISFYTGNPIRVVRSWNCHSEYSPISGYRYDGLYKVAAHWDAKGLNGKNICRVRLERLPGQPPIPLRPVTIPGTNRRRRTPLVSGHRFCPSFSSPRDTTDKTILPDEPNQRAMTETFGLTDVDLDELETDMKHPQLLSPQQDTPSVSRALPRYRWDARNNILVKITTSNEDADAVHRGEENTHEDDATLASSEDGYEVPADERMECDERL